MGKIISLIVFAALFLAPVGSQNSFAAVYSGDAERLFVTPQDIFPSSIEFNPDGTKLFVLGSEGDDVNEYACGTGFDVSTCVYSGDAERFSIMSQEANPSSIEFNPDGTKMFVMGNAGDDVNEYACGTGFDVSTCVYSGDAERFHVTEAFPTDLAFNPDGTKMFVLGLAALAVMEYACGTGFDVSTCVYSGDAERLSISSQDSLPASLEFSTDGTKLFVLGISFDNVYEYACGTGFDVSTCVYSGDAERFSTIATAGNFPQSIAFNPDGTKMFVIDTNLDDYVNEYSLELPFDVQQSGSCGLGTIKQGNFCVPDLNQICGPNTFDSGEQCAPDLEEICGEGTFISGLQCLGLGMQAVGGTLLEIDTVAVFVAAIGVNPIITGLVVLSMAGIAGQAAWFVHKRNKKSENS